jgi:hypothetical protein
VVGVNRILKIVREVTQRVGERRWKQITVVMKTGERQVWHDARLCRRTPHAWTAVILRDGRMMLYPKSVIARVGVGPRANVGQARIFG